MDQNDLSIVVRECMKARGASLANENRLQDATAWQGRKIYVYLGDVRELPEIIIVYQLLCSARSTSAAPP